MSIDFQPAGPDDAETLMGLIRQLYAADAAIGSALDEAGARAALAQVLADSALGRAWLIREGEQVIGYAVLAFGFSLEFRGRFAFLDEFYVAPSHQGQGVGTRALDFVAEQCRALGIAALRLEVERANTRAQAFYRRGGFRAHDRDLMTKWVGDAGS